MEEIHLNENEVITLSNDELNDIFVDIHEGILKEPEGANYLFYHFLGAFIDENIKNFKDKNYYENVMVKCYLKSIEMNNYRESMNNLGIYYFEKNNFDLGKKYCMMAGSGSGYHNMGYYSYKNFEHDAAIEYFKKAIENEFYESCGLLADLYYSCGNIKKALEYAYLGCVNNQYDAMYFLSDYYFTSLVKKKIIVKNYNRNNEMSEFNDENNWYDELDELDDLDELDENDYSENENNKENENDKINECIKYFIASYNDTDTPENLKEKIKKKLKLTLIVCFKYDVLFDFFKENKIKILCDFLKLCDNELSDDVVNYLSEQEIKELLFNTNIYFVNYKAIKAYNEIFKMFKMYNNVFYRYRQCLNELLYGKNETIDNLTILIKNKTYDENALNELTNEEFENYVINYVPAYIEKFNHKVFKAMIKINEKIKIHCKMNFEEYELTEEAYTCPITWIEENEGFKIKNCGHVFSSDIFKCNSCPLCRGKN